MRLFFFISTLLISSMALSQTYCEGFVDVPAFKQKKQVIVSFENLQELSWIKMNTPITSDLEPDFAIQIRDISETKRSTKVHAQYVGLSGEISFTFVKRIKSKSYIKDFQGTEEGIAFGPAVLYCK